MELDRFAAGRANVVARWRGSGGEPALLFNGHLDTVPVEREQWRHDPHAAVVEGDVLHGRGTVDMKGGVAALAMACATLARAGVRLQRDLIFAGTAGEEVDCCGSQRLAAGDLGPVGALVVGEPTRLQVVTAHKGALWLEIATSGRAAHGSMPEQGRNAIAGMCRIIDRLQAYRPAHRPHPLLGPPTVNLGTIRGRGQGQHRGRSVRAGGGSQERPRSGPRRLAARRVRTGGHRGIRRGRCNGAG